MRSRSLHTRAAAVAVTVVATICAGPALADDSAAFARAEEPTSFSDRIGWAFTMGYGHGFNMRARTQGLDVTETRMLLFMPHARIELFDLAERQRWWAGALDFVLEPELAINFAPDDTIQSRFDYTYDANGNRTSMTTLDGVHSYEYDLTGQLTKVTYPDGQWTTYAYDPVGNRTTVTEKTVES